MSRRNTRHAKARRRAERDRRQVTEREQKRPRTSDQGPRAVEDQAVQAAPRPDGSGPRNSDERGSGLRSDANGGLIAVNFDEADLDTDADLDIDDLDADDASLQAALADEDLDEADVIAEVAAVAEELAAGDVDGPEGSDSTDEVDGSGPRPGRGGGRGG